MRYLAIALLVVVSQQTQACRSCRSAPEPAPSALDAAASASAAPDAATPVPSSLPPRRPPPSDLARSHRARVLQAIGEARTAIDSDRPRDALITLARAAQLDPTGGVLAVEMSRAAAAAGDERRARQWARRATERASGNASVEAAAERASKAANAQARPGLEAGSSGPFPTSKEACAQLTREVELGKSHALGLAQHDVTAIDCQAGPPRRVGDAGLESATELRLTIAEGGRTEASWVALRTERGLMLHGPLVRVHTPAAHDVVNAYALRLEPINALAGGRKELSVGIDERLTRLDLALNETLSVDRTRVVVLTLDRAPIMASPSATTFELSDVRAIDGRDEEPPPEPYRHSSLWNAPRTQRFRLRWSDNELVLVPRTPDATSKDERRTVLFP